MTLIEIIHPTKLNYIEEGWHFHPGNALWEIVTTLRIILYPLTDGSWLGYLPKEYEMPGWTVTRSDPQETVLTVCRMLLEQKGADFEIPGSVESP